MNFKGLSKSIISTSRITQAIQEPCQITSYVPLLHYPPHLQSILSPCSSTCFDLSAMRHSAQSVSHLSQIQSLHLSNSTVYPSLINPTSLLTTAITRSRNSSIVDLRMKAKRHQATMILNGSN